MMQNNLYNVILFPKQLQLLYPLFLIFSPDFFEIIKKAWEFTLDYNIECPIFQSCQYDDK